jgi:hypothetical protein
MVISYKDKTVDEYANTNKYIYIYICIEREREKEHYI